MMSSPLKTLAILALVAGIVWVLWDLFLKGPRLDIRTALPEALKKMHLWQKEKRYECGAPIGLVCRIDEAYMDEHGTITLSETKTRRWPKVYDSDILQLSAQRLAVSENGRRVSDTGYVRLITPTGNEYRQVRLLDPDEVIAAKLLYDDLVQGKYAGRPCNNRAICQTCLYQSECEALG